MNESFDFDADVDYNWDEGPMDDFGPPEPPNRFNRYNNAFGNYRGGYGPPGGFDGPPDFGPRFGPGFPPGPPRPPPPTFIFGRGFGPNGPPPRLVKDDRAYRYLLRCGVSRENLRNLPRELYNLIQPEFCGLCSQSFNSFSVSRLHYTSKNHLKNQRKFLIQNRPDNSFGEPRQKETPLKSRELYCELCDVQITSKVHAESHYSGRPHRAIVFGRKPPKNPNLLPRNMANRLDQLIRREKRSLPPLEETATVDNAAETPKPTDPDLFCEICNTSVTCSDQMTMHLNGKKHLTKEKRHILEMMTGTKTNPEDEDNDDEAENIQLKPEKTATGGTETLKQSSKLYCALCKISVTSTEHMTMHLNGRKHQTKENNSTREMTASNNGRSEGNNKDSHTGGDEDWPKGENEF